MTVDTDPVAPADPAPAVPPPTEVPHAPEPVSGKKVRHAPIPNHPPPTAGQKRLLVKGMKPQHVVEAALFSAGHPVAIEEIAHETGLSSAAIEAAVRDLERLYDERDTVLEIRKAGAKWALQVRSAAAEPAARFAPMEIAPKLLKTLALIAYHQPMRQSELVEMVGPKAYDHVPELVERGLVRSREEGSTKILSTTPQFPEYFGLDATDAAQVKAAMGKLVGLP
ncbi:MAG: SMC-Scp complex subunit ScpB [Thermoplasmatota archaeon]